jgi:polyhydroxyalkanoate synthase
MKESAGRKSKAAAPKPRAAKPKAAAAPDAKAAAPPPAPAVSAAVSLDMLSTTQRESLERLSLNLARAAMTAQGAIAEAALRQADRPSALTPDPFHVAPALTEVMARLAAQPDRLMRAQADLFGRYMDLWKAAASRVHGEPATEVAQPAKGDKRFVDPDWSQNPVFDVIKQSYLITSDWLNELVGGVEGV